MAFTLAADDPRMVDTKFPPEELLRDGKVTVDSSIPNEAPAWDNIGGLIGTAREWSYGCRVNRATVKATVRGRNYIGGIVGRGRVDVRNSTFEGNVVGNNQIGAVVGRLDNAEGGDAHNIENVEVKGRVIGVNDIGGAVGYAYEAISVDKAMADVRVYGNTNVGGFIGTNRSYWGTMKNAFALGTVIGNERVGGFIGRQIYRGGTPFVLSHSFASGDVYGDTTVGGFAGDASNVAIEYVYSAGGISLWDSPIGSAVNAMFGAGSEISKAFFNSTDSKKQGGQGVGKEAEEMRGCDHWVAEGFEETCDSLAQWYFTDDFFPQLDWYANKEEAE